MGKQPGGGQPSGDDSWEPRGKGASAKKAAAAAKKAAAAAAAAAGYAPKAGGKGNGGGGAVTKANLKKVGGKKTFNKMTPEKKPICFAFGKGNCPGGCGRAHVCQKCFGDHPYSSPDCTV